MQQHGMLRVEGNRTVDQHGLPVRLRGMSLFWSDLKPGPQFYNADVVAWLRDDWRVSVLRAAMGVEQGGYLTNPGTERAKVEAVVEAAISQGIYVIIDWHDHHAEDHLEESRQFFSDMAQKYGGHANVIFETYNEPEGDVSWSDVVKPYHVEIVKAIRQYSNNIIVMGTPFWSQWVDIASEDPVEGENLAYTIHFYAASHGQSLRDKAAVALSNGIAIFATEWGTCTFTGSGDLDFNSTRLWQKFLQANGISDANWAVDDKAESCAALVPGASSTGHWLTSQLSQSGTWVRNSIRDYNSRRA